MDRAVRTTWGHTRKRTVPATKVKRPHGVHPGSVLLVRLITGVTRVSTEKRGHMLGSPDSGVPVLGTRSARRRRVLMPLLIVIVVGIVALLLAGRGQQTQITGAGSTLAQPL